MSRQPRICPPDVSPAPVRTASNEDAGPISPSFIELDAAAAAFLEHAIDEDFRSPNRLFRRFGRRHLTLPRSVEDAAIREWFIERIRREALSRSRQRKRGSRGVSAPVPHLPQAPEPAQRNAIDSVSEAVAAAEALLHFLRANQGRDTEIGLSNAEISGEGTAGRRAHRARAGLFAPSRGNGGTVPAQRRPYRLGAELDRHFLSDGDSAPYALKIENIRGIDRRGGLQGDEGGQ